jgi:uncharacterized protein YaaR (DUF327 family)
MNITQMLQSTSSNAAQKRVETQKETDKKFDLENFKVLDKQSSDSSQLHKGRDNPELNRELNKAFVEANTPENVERYKQLVAKFRNSVKVDFSDDIKNHYKKVNGYIPVDWSV